MPEFPDPACPEYIRLYQHRSRMDTRCARRHTPNGGQPYPCRRKQEDHFAAQRRSRMVQQAYPGRCTLLNLPEKDLCWLLALRPAACLQKRERPEQVPESRPAQAPNRVAVWATDQAHPANRRPPIRNKCAPLQTAPSAPPPYFDIGRQ